MSEPVEIPLGALPAETLQQVLEEQVTRDGTELTPVREKVARLRELLERGRARLFFDPDSGTCQVVVTEP